VRFRAGFRRINASARDSHAGPWTSGQHLSAAEEKHGDQQQTRKQPLSVQQK
jgi:hypothetical protein